MGASQHQHMFAIKKGKKQITYPLDVELAYAVMEELSSLSRSTIAKRLGIKPIAEMYGLEDIHKGQPKGGRF